MRALALCLLLVAAPAAASAQTAEQRAVADCIRQQPIENLIHKRSSCVAPDPLPATRIFPLAYQQSAAREIVRFRLALDRCPRARPTPEAKVLWRSVLRSYPATPPDVPAIRAWIDREFAKERQTPPIGPVEYRCEQAKNLYGEFGRVVRNGIVMRDGSSTVRQCVFDSSCSSADTLDVWLY